MAPARKSRKARAKARVPVTAPAPAPVSVPVPKRHFLKLPPELRITIYELVLLQPEPIIVKWHDPLPKDPPLTATCKQIRKEASSVYGKNHLEIHLQNLKITKVTDWMQLSPPRMALYQGAEMVITIFNGDWGEKGAPGGKPWENMLAWIELYHEGRCCRLVDLPKESSEDEDDEPEPKPSLCHQVQLAVKIFDEVDELLEKDDNMTLAELLQAVSKHEGTMARFYG